MRGDEAGIVSIGSVWGLCVGLVLIGIGALAILCRWFGRKR